MRNNDRAGTVPDRPPVNPWAALEPRVSQRARNENTRTADVSVVMATYNGARYLEAALACVAQQSVQPTEVIVVDDGSTDGSADIAERAGARVVRLSRSGVCAARNRGIREAASSWVAFLDQDDLWLPTKLERQWSAHERHADAVMIATDASKIDGDNEILSDSFLHVGFMAYDRMHPTTRLDRTDYFADGVLELEHAGWFLLPSAVMAHRDVLMEVGMFDERITLNEDVSCFLRVLSKGALVVIDEPLTGWRIHGSNTHRNELGMLRGRLALTNVARKEPDGYPAWFLRRLQVELPSLLMEIGRREMAVGNMPAARSALSEARKRGAGTHATLLSLASFLGARNVERLAALRRRLRGPSER